MYLHEALDQSDVKTAVNESNDGMHLVAHTETRWGSRQILLFAYYAAYPETIIRKFTELTALNFSLARWGKIDDAGWKPVKQSETRPLDVIRPPLKIAS